MISKKMVKFSLEISCYDDLRSLRGTMRRPTKPNTCTNRNISQKGM